MFVDDLRQRFYELSKAFPGYDEVLAQALFALLAEEHVLWYSGPGRAKTAVTEAVIGLFDGASTFRRQITADTTADDLFGSIIVDDLMQGRQHYNLAGGIVTSDFAYLNEFFDGPDMLLRMLLDIFHERQFATKDQGVVKSGLHTVFMTTNFLRMRQALDAVTDRIMCQAVLPGIELATDFMTASSTYLSHQGKGPVIPPLPYDGLRQLAKEVQLPEEQGGIRVSPGMRFLHTLLVQEFIKRRVKAATAQWHADNPDAAEEPTAADLGIREISPRSLIKFHDLSRANATLEHRSVVTASDLRALGYGLYVIGDGSGDNVLWRDLCREMLSFGSNVEEELEYFGELAMTIGQLKVEEPQTPPAEFALGGTAYVKTSAGIRKAFRAITRRKHPVLDLAEAGIEAGITDLEAERDGYNLSQGAWRA